MPWTTEIIQDSLPTQGLHLTVSVKSFPMAGTLGAGSGDLRRDVFGGWRNPILLTILTSENLLVVSKISSPLRFEWR